MGEENTIYLIDGSSYIYRAFYAITTPLRSPDGFPTQAVFGFAQMLQKVLNEKKPEYVCIVFDAPGPKFRHDIYPEYKATREVMPDDLVVQVEYVKKLCDAYGIPRLEMEGYEADDIIASITEWAKEKGFRVVIVSGDKDLHQLVENRKIVQWDPQRDVWYDDKKIVEKFGVPPEKMCDFLALVGDSSDNIPGVPGIGAKRAVSILKKVNSIEEIFTKPEVISSESLRKKLIDHKDKAILSKQLVMLKKDALKEISIDLLKPRERNFDELVSLYKRLGFKKFLSELEKENSKIGDFHLEEAKIKRTVEIVDSVEILEDLLKQIRESGCISIDLETTSEDPVNAEIVGISFSFRPYKAYYVPIKHTKSANCKKQIPLDKVLSLLKDLLEDENFPKYGQNLKYEQVVFKKYGIELKGIEFDTMLASYLLEPGQHAHRLEWIVEKYLGEQMTSYKDLTSSGRGSRKKNISFAEVPVSKAAEYAGADSEVVIRLVPILKRKLDEEGLFKLYRNLEIPLISVLASMEYRGVKLDSETLLNLSKELELALQQCEQRIYALSGTEFNIQSPKQLGEILFQRLGLPVIKKTKTGPSTDMSVLEALASHHPIVTEILTHRSLSKLKNTYVDALPKMVNPRTGRIHTSYNQTVTATGRLSSSNPNLQNIPIRTEEGRKIRRAFIPDEGYLFLSADYSQIELRILAHYSEDQKLIDAFLAGDDIHARTASRIFQVPLEEVTQDMRRFAKTINFGIIYGMGPYGLSKALKIGKSEAKKIIDQYFSEYEHVKKFIENTIKETTEKGFCTTLMGRKRYIPELKDRSRVIRQQGERLAVNTTIQGSAADIIKKAMIDIYDELNKIYKETFLVLQVHDELVFEVPEDKLDEISNLVRDMMENVCTLRVPLTVDIGYGKNWAEAHP